MSRVKQLEIDIFESTVENDEEYTPPAGFPYSPPPIDPCPISAVLADDADV